MCVDPTNANVGNPQAPTPDFGVKDLGATCGSFTDCRKPYLCAHRHRVADLSEVPLYFGPSCIRSYQEAGDFRGYFEVPPATIPADFEFYRLPFPNDIRVVAGHISLTGHASPGLVLGVDVAGNYFSGIEEDADGFALDSSVFFRFTDPPTNGSLCLEAAGVYPRADATLCASGQTSCAASHPFVRVAAPRVSI